MDIFELREGASRGSFVPFWPQKAKNDPKSRSKYNVKIEGSIEIQIDPKNFLNIASAPKLAHSGPKKAKRTQKLGPNQK